MAEWLRYLQDTESHLILLAECYLADNTPYKSYNLLKGARSIKAKYLFAISCIRINKLVEAEEILVKSEGHLVKFGSKVNPDSVINGEHGLYLLA